MKPPRSGKRNHPTAETLALYVRSDLPLLVRLRCKRHVAHCETCEAQAVAFRSSLAELKSEAAGQRLTGFEAITNWNRLEREMLGNIVVGVAAARCIDNVGLRRVWLPRLAFGAGLSVLFIAGWATHIPRDQTERITSAISQALHGERPKQIGSVVQTTPTGIAVRSQGVTLTIMHPRTALVSVSGASAVEARYIDEDSGQITITNVYGH